MLTRVLGYTGRHLARASRHGALFFPIMFGTCIAIAGGFGRSYGVHNLFRDDLNPFTVPVDTRNPLVEWLIRFTGSAAFETQVYAIAVIGCMWTAIRLLEERRDERAWRLEGGGGAGAVAASKPEKTAATPLEVLTGIPADAAAGTAGAANSGTGDGFQRLRVGDLLPGVAILALFPLIAAWVPLGFRLGGNWQDYPRFVLPLLGFAAGMLVYYGYLQLIFGLARITGMSRVRSMLIVSSAVALAVTYLVPIVLPAKFLFIVTAWIVIVYAALAAFPPWVRVLALIAAVALVYLANNTGVKLTFPNMASYYSAPRNLSDYYDEIKGITATVARRQMVQMQRQAPVSCDPATAPAGTPRSDRPDPVDSLRHWHRQMSQDKPKMVVMTTTGGAYRAAFWTAMILDRMIELEAKGELPRFRQGVRLLTGASGGMIASAYFATLATPPGVPEKLGPGKTSLARLIEDDIASAQSGPNRVRNPVVGRRDSLSSVLSELVRWDIPGILWLGKREHDRGRELESHWKSIRVKWADLRQGEAEGWRPSLVFSPMLAATGQPMFVTNLDLSTVIHGPRDQRAGGSHEAIEFFGLFPQAHGTFHLATAARMSATFPWVSPPVQLPLTQRHRVVDAGYYDNYGVSVALRLLDDDEIRQWLHACTSGVILVQIRAFRSDLLKEGGTKKQGSYFEQFGWLTAPLEGAAAASDSAQLLRNNQMLRTSQRLYRLIPGQEFLQTVVFEPPDNEDTSMTWDLPSSELARMRKDLEADVNLQAMDRLRTLWRGGP